jgi:EpsI family protein
MVMSMAMATWLTPRMRWYDYLGHPDYQAIIPKSFGDWIETEDSTNGIVDPAITESLNVIYSQMANRTYLHKPSGRHVMVSVAYGVTQQGATQLHRPESCYSSQGFTIESLASDNLAVGYRSIPIYRMTTIRKPRTEQVTYWIRVGDRVIDGPPYRLNLTRMSLALHGFIADGLLFRTSEITSNARDSYLLQDRFIGDLLNALTPHNKRTLIGMALT